MKQRSLLIFGTGTVAEIAGYYFTAIRTMNSSVLSIINRTDTESLMPANFPYRDGITKFRQADTDFVAVGYQGTNSSDKTI